MSIRPFCEQDFPQIETIYALSKLDELRFEPVRFQLLPLREDPKRFAALKESDIFVFEHPDDASKIMAFAAVCQSEIRNLFVHPLFRGNGIGKTLLTFLLQRIPGPASLNVAKNNVPAIKLYQRFGFNIVDEFETQYNGTAVMANTMRQSENLNYPAD